MRIFYLSWIAPVEGSGATLAMRRHFVEHRDFEVFVATTADFCEPGIPSLKLQRAAWFQRLSNTRFVRLVRNFELLFYGTRLDRRVLNAAKEFRPDAVFTVADMTLCEQARKLAKRLGVPLVVNFQDWWPQGQFYYWHEKPYFWVRPILEWRFRRLYREADLAFCTSEGMKEFLGPHPNSHVLYPIGARDAEASCPMLVAPEDRRSARLSCGSTSRAEEIGDRAAAPPPMADGGGLMAEGSKLVPSSVTERAFDAGRWSLAPSSPATSVSLPVTARGGHSLDAGCSTLDFGAAKRRKKRLIYTGTAFGSYGKMLRELARELEMQGDWELVIFGNSPDWPEGELENAKQTGLYRGLLKFEELQRELHEADACLAVMSFEPELEVMMRTSFTTKMLDYCRIGKPLILWGPEYCSPIRLASSKQAAECITTNSASFVWNVLQKMILHPALKYQLEKAAKKLAENELSHFQIHGIFRKQIKSMHEKSSWAKIS